MSYYIKKICLQTVKIACIALTYTILIHDAEVIVMAESEPAKMMHSTAKVQTKCEVKCQCKLSGGALTD